MMDVVGMMEMAENINGVEALEGTHWNVEEEVTRSCCDH